MNRQLLRAIASIVFGVTAMAAVAYLFGWMSRTAWVLWLAPLTVALEGSLLFRPGIRGRAALSPSELPVVGDLGVSVFLVTSGVAAGVTAWGAYTGNSLALMLGAAGAILGTVLQRREEPAFERPEMTARRHAVQRSPSH